MKHFLMMVQFFTRIPVPVELQLEEGDFPKGIKYFPVVGLLLGLLSVGVYWVAVLLWEKPLAAGLTCLFNVLVTGALHLDGLADTCDGLFSARSKEKMLEIMRDSRIGTNGALALFFDLGLKWALLTRVSDAWFIPVLVAIPVLSRTGMTGLLCTCPPARSGQGLGNLFIGKAGFSDVAIAGTLALGLAAVCLRLWLFPVLGFNLLGLWGYRQLVMARIGGMTGDTLGAGNEWSEILTLLAVTAMQ